MTISQDQHPSPEVDSYLSERVVWLIRLRWMAIAGILVTLLVCWWLGLIFRFHEFLVVALIMGFYNLFFWRWARHNSGQAAPVAFRTVVFRQLSLDLAALAVLLHFAGGMENPFVSFFSFHMAIGAMLLPLDRAVQLGVLAIFLHGGAVLGGFLGLFSRHPLQMTLLGRSAEQRVIPYESGYLVLGYLMALALTLFGVIYFVHSIAVRHREEEERRKRSELVALSRARLARVGEISAGVAHNIRNPLHGVMNGMEILRRRIKEGGAWLPICLLISEGLERIETITRRLLILTRDAPLHRRATDVNEMVRETLEFLAVRHSRYEIETELGEVPLGNIDAGRYSEALLNVVDNALAACREGQIRIRTFQCSEDGDRIGLEVSDTGEGIPAENTSRVFDPFFTTKAVGEGTGLGLAIARQVAEEHGGEIILKSQPGQGTQVCFLIPAHS